MLLNLTNLSRSLMMIVTCLVMITDAQEESYRRCYTCRSRGELGDCGDTFSPPPPFNATNPAASLVRHVKESPCYSGWCFKQIDGEVGDSTNTAMERGCMVRKPSDSKQRCAYVMKSYKRVYMCFCQGDQCNGVGVSTRRFFIIGILLGLLRLL